jgi:putative hydrolase
MAEAAGAAGLVLWGLSDHVRADTTWLDGYSRTVRALRVDGLVVLAGVESKILTSKGALDLPRELPPLDYLLISDHQFPGTDGPVHPARISQRIAEGSLGPLDALGQLVAATCMAVHVSPLPPILAHLFSLLPKCGLTEDLVGEEHLNELANACLSADAAVEVNEKWRCPSARVLTHLQARGVRLTAGSDAHRAEAVGRWSYLDEVGAEP